MNVAIVHYHLGHGGVPQVVRRTSPLLTRHGVNHVILVGHYLPEDGDLPIGIVTGLGYAEKPEVTAETLVDELQSAAERTLGGPPDIWHFHNHSLGKNTALTEAAAMLAARGERVLFHIHDLAEDGRASLYAGIRHLSSLYPFSPRVHYAFLNHRDRTAFLSAGLPESQSSILQGPITTQEFTSSDPPPIDRPPLLFAPIRGIRRKNLGELVLVSRLLPPPVRVAISRPPVDPASLAIHETWRAFAAIHAPRIDFAVSDRIPPAPDADCGFASWIRHSTHIIGTSIAEGLGLSFLESSLWQRPFIGRRLAHLHEWAYPGSCYDRLLVPKEWFSVNILREQLAVALARDDRTRRTHPRLPDLETILDHLTNGDWLDFGNLPESLQQAVIERCGDPSARGEIHVEIDSATHPALPWLLDRVTHPRLPSSIVHTPTGDPLPIYQNLLNAPAGDVSHLSPSSIFAAFHTPTRFHFLTAPPPPAGTLHSSYQAVIFDIYGTLLHTTHGPVRPDPRVDPALCRMIRQFGYVPPDSPTTALHEAVLRHHASSGETYPEVDLRTLWMEILELPAGTDMERFVIATEDIRSPAHPVRGAFQAVRRISAAGIRLGILSNAQCNALHSLEDIADLFDPDLILLSHQTGAAKPSPRLFEEMSSRLTALGIDPSCVLYVGNSPDHDIIPAQSQGWHTAHFADHPSPACSPTLTFHHYPQLLRFLFAAARSIA